MLKLDLKKEIGELGALVIAFIIGFVYPFCKGVYLSFCKFWYMTP